MSASLAQRQQQLMAYLQGHAPMGKDHIHHHVVQQGKVATSQRLGIYQNAYNMRLKETIDTDHQILGRYLGDELYNGHPQIAELARFERLLLCAFDAFDTDRATLNQLKSLAQDKWPNISLRFHPSVQLFVSSWNVVAMWQQLKQEQTPPDPVSEKNAWLVWRNVERLTEFRPIDNTALAMLEMFQQGKNFASQ